MRWCVIPARRYSVGVPGKNLRPLPDGSTLVGRAVAVAEAVTNWRPIVLASDYTPVELRDVPEVLVPEVLVVSQPAACVAGQGSMLELLRAVLCAVPTIAPDDDIILLQPTSPLRTAATVEAAVRRYYQRLGQRCDTVCTAMRIPDRWHPAYVLSEGMTLPALRQDLSPAYRPDGGAYVTSARQIRTGVWGRIGYLVSPVGESLSIDTPTDWAELVCRMEGRRST